MLRLPATAFVSQSVAYTVTLIACAYGLISVATAAPPPVPEADPSVSGRRRIIVRSPLMMRDPRHGRLIVAPNVEISTMPVRTGSLSAQSATHPILTQFGRSNSLPSISAEIGQVRLNSNFERFQLPERSLSGESLAPPVTDPLFEQVGKVPAASMILYGDGEDCDDHKGLFGCDKCSPWRQLFAFDLFKTSTDIGIGEERVMHAVFAMDRTEPLNNVLFRYDSFRGMVTPDRAEYFWANPLTGPPLPESGVDYQNLIFSMESGGDRFSMLTEIPIRMLDPVNNGNTTGLGDISFGPKVVLIKGKRWQLAHIFRTFLATGSTLKGLGTGHVSLEPGLLIRYKWTPRTYLHGELKYRFPVGADPAFSGQVLRYGFGVATVLYETDTFAMLPTLEFIGWSVLDGRKTLPNGLAADVDGEMFFSIQPGMRFVLGPKGDLGLFEFGISGAANFSNNGFFDSLLRIDFRFSY